MLSLFVLSALVFALTTSNDVTKSSQDEDLEPSVLVVFLARNKAHALPYFLGYFERLTYRKDRISIWIRTDHNDDETGSLLANWSDSVRAMYRHVDFVHSLDVVYVGSGRDWPRERFEHLLRLKDEALKFAREIDVDYVLYIDMDNIIVNPDMLSQLIAQQKPVVAPMMDPPVRSANSNFWCGVDENGYYRRTEDYFPTLYRERLGCFEVPMIHSTYLIDMRFPGSEKLTYITGNEYNLGFDDLLVFAYQARKAGMKLFVLNTEVFMRMPWTSGEYSSLQNEQDKTETFFINELSADGPVIRSEHLPYTKPQKTKFSFDKIYLINLPRRTSRRLRMTSVLDYLGIEYEFADAVDGRNLTKQDLKDFGIQMLDGYSDPINDRPLTMGEIGCFLSHFKIWADVLANGFNEILVLEDDLHFESYFRTNLEHLVDDIKDKNLDWDLIYLGRKRLNDVSEPAVKEMTLLVQPGYSYWTLAYMLSKSGARKLIQAKPLSKMMAVDEYLSLMFDQHPRDDWKGKFEHRNVQAFSVDPLLIYPTHYTKDHSYFSDTEASTVAIEKQAKDEL